MTPEPAARESLPEAVVEVLDEFRRSFSLDLHLWARPLRESASHVYSTGDGEGPRSASGFAPPRRTDAGGSQITLEVRNCEADAARAAAVALRTALEHLFDYSEEVRFFTFEGVRAVRGDQPPLLDLRDPGLPLL